MSALPCRVIYCSHGIKMVEVFFTVKQMFCSKLSVSKRKYSVDVTQFRFPSAQFMQRQGCSFNHVMSTHTFPKQRYDHQTDLAFFHGKYSLKFLRIISD